MTATEPDPAPEDVRTLLFAVQQWAQRALPAPPSGHGGPECQWCPLCQLAAALRGEHPELTDRLAEASGAVAGAVRALLESAARAAPTGRRPPADASVPSEASVPAEASAPAEASVQTQPADPSDRIQPSDPARPNGSTARPASRPRPRIERIRLDDTSSSPSEPE